MVLHGVAVWHSNDSNTRFYDLIHLCRGLNRPKCQIICSRRQSSLNAAGGGAGWFFNVFHGTPQKRSVKDTSGLPSLKNDVVEKKLVPFARTVPHWEVKQMIVTNSLLDPNGPGNPSWDLRMITTAGLSSVRLPDPLDIVSGAIWC